MPRAGGSALRPLRLSPIGGLVENARLFGQGEFTGYSSGGLHRGKCMSRVSHRPSGARQHVFVQHLSGIVMCPSALSALRNREGEK